MRRSFTAILLMAAFVLQAQTPNHNAKTANELYGFLLRQGPDAFEKKLGKPFKTGTDEDGARFFAYELAKDSDAYVVVVFKMLEKHLQAVKIELTGKTSPEPARFFLLGLGTPEKEVLEKLGKPEKVSHENDVNVDLWDWPSRNYSLELTPDKKIYSFQIVDPLEDSRGVPEQNDVKEFVNAMTRLNQGGDVDALLKVLSGDVSCSNGKDHGLTEGSAWDQLSRTKDGLRVCLSEAVDALTPAILSQAETDIRMYSEADTLPVVKFPAACRLGEIVFRWEAGAWRIYEVTLR